MNSTSPVQAEVSLRESERRFRAIFNGTFQFTGLLITEGIVLKVNQTALGFGELQPQNVVEHPCWEIWWTLLVSQQHLQYLLSPNPAVIYSCKSYRNFGNTFISENIVAITSYQARKILEGLGFWASHLHPVLKSFYRVRNVGNILGIRLRMAILKKCTYIQT